MEDFDLLYLMKTPFFMGEPAKVMTQSDNCEVSDDDQKTMALKALLILRALSI